MSIISEKGNLNIVNIIPYLYLNINIVEQIFFIDLSLSLTLTSYAI